MVDVSTKVWSSSVLMKVRLLSDLCCLTSHTFVSHSARYVDCETLFAVANRTDGLAGVPKPNKALPRGSYFCYGNENLKEGVAEV